MSLLGTSGFALGRRTGLCASTGEPIAEGVEVVTMLVESDEADEGIARLDFAAEAWDQGARPAEGQRVFAFWRGTQPASGANTNSRLISDEELLELFSRTATEQDDPRQVTFRYVLGLLLIRRRLLSVLKTARKDNADVLHVRVRGRPDEVLEVTDPGLDDTQLEAETEALLALLAPEDDTPQPHSEPQA